MFNKIIKLLFLAVFVLPISVKADIKDTLKDFFHLNKEVSSKTQPNTCSVTVSVTVSVTEQDCFPPLSKNQELNDYIKFKCDPNETHKIIKKTAKASWIKDKGPTILERCCQYAKKPDWIDAETWAIMFIYNVPEDAKFYRVISKDDFKNYAKKSAKKKASPCPSKSNKCVILANPTSMAKVEDFYEMNENPYYKEGAPASQYIASIKWANTKAQGKEHLLEASYNMALKDPSSYANWDEYYKMSISLKDVLLNGGKIYKDIGANDQGIEPFILTVPNSVRGLKFNMEYIKK